ncbi:MAG: peptidase, partial [Betaproteobacteria bacterium]|nr:peptidase [Betaproteobacteria bacterium]
MKANGLKLTLAILATALGIAYFMGDFPGLGHSHAATQPATAIAAASPAPPVSLPDMSSIVARDGPAVVNISITGMRKIDNDGPGIPELDPNDPFYDFFRHFRPPQPQGEEAVRSEGSGFI